MIQCEMTNSKKQHIIMGYFAIINQFVLHQRDPHKGRPINQFFHERHPSNV